MNEFVYTVKVKTAEGEKSIVGRRPPKGALHIVEDLPSGVILEVKGRMPLDVKDREKIFICGYQTWTYCPEWTKKSRLKPHQPLPKFAIDKFRIDRYGDYHFVDYEKKKGVLHGESYGYVRNGDTYRLFASLNEAPGYTIFRYIAGEGILEITRDCAGVKCGGKYDLFDLFFAKGGEDEVFDAWFAEMGVKPMTDRAIKGYSSWYNRYENISEQSILEDLEGCSGVMEQGDLFQVDDGWEPKVGDWLDCDPVKFPDGMKKVCDAIHEKGFSAGLWLAPFVCGVGSKIEKEHPDWMLKVNGEPWICGCNWGGFFALDIDNPEVISYLEKVFHRVFDEWGFDLVKLDFLYGAAPYGNERESRAGRMIRAMKLLRKWCGEHPILGCGVPVMPAFGLVEYCRVSCDVSLDWDDKPYMRLIHRERTSTKQALETSIFRRQLNGRAYLSDPDVFFLRDDNLRLTENQKLALATANRVLGGVWLCSDNMGLYDDKKKKIYRDLAHLTLKGGISVDADDGLKLSYDAGKGKETIDIYRK